MELDIWRADWGLCSVDIDCLRVLIYSKIIGIPLKIRETNNPFWSPKGYLPVLRDGKRKYSGFDEITNHFSSQGYSLDKSISNSEHSLAEAYYEHMKTKLLPGLWYVWWVDAKNYTEFVRPWYAKALPFPLNYIYPGRYERQSKAFLEVVYGEDLTPREIEEAAYADAHKCITMLSNKLGESEFFLGSQPSTVDANVFAYLAPLLRAPLPSCALQNYLKQCENLVKFVNRICEIYFPEIHAEYLKFQKKVAEENRKKMKKAQEKGQGDGDDFPHKKRSYFLAGLVAFSAMAGYAVSLGLLQLPPNNIDESYPVEIMEDEDE